MRRAASSTTLKRKQEATASQSVATSHLFTQKPPSERPLCQKATSVTNVATLSLIAVAAPTERVFLPTPGVSQIQDHKIPDTTHDTIVLGERGATRIADLISGQ
jgi:hypothetical protein